MKKKNKILKNGDFTIKIIQPLSLVKILGQINLSQKI